MYKRFAAILAMICLFGTASAAKTIWVKGNLHTHTNHSDGDSSPRAVADWYKSHGYQFLVITDHRKCTEVSDLTGKDFVVIGGEELQTLGESLLIHANAIGITHELTSPKRSSTPGASALHILDISSNAGGVPMLNHPYFYPLYGFQQLYTAKYPFLMEIFNGAYDPEKLGDAPFMIAELMWDSLLTQGRQVYGTAADDSHIYKNAHGAPRNPGRGWVVVRVPALTRSAILSALRRGDFYASTGIELAELGLDRQVLSVRVKPHGAETYKITFIGKEGKVIRSANGPTATCKIPTGPNAYLRCKIVSNTGKTAWTQAFRNRGSSN